MARLIIQAVATKLASHIGTNSPIMATVSVTRSTGVAVTTLTQNDFIVGCTWAPFFVSIVDFLGGGSTQVAGGSTSRPNAGGFYRMKLAPPPGAVWTNDIVQHAVFVVDNGVDHGQTVIDLSLAG